MAVTALCRALLLLLALLHAFRVVDWDACVEKLWRALYDMPQVHSAMGEAAVASVSFLWWICWFEFLDRLPCLHQFRIIQRHSPHALFGRVRLRDVLSLPVYLAAIYALHLLKDPRPVDAAAPSAVRLVCEVVLGLWAYDFIFYWIHLAMHLFPGLPHGHGIHHQMRASMDGKEYFTADTVVHHSLLDGGMQVAINILVQNLPLFYGLRKHKLSRFLHNIVVTYLLSEAHCGLDLPWASHRLLPGLLGGVHRHEIHHHRRDCCFHQFFCYLDDLLGYGPPTAPSKCSCKA